MKFTGQVRVPELDHPGVPATLLVEEGQVEVFLDGESLGRWSLYDVHAARLVSSAFSLSLGGEEITFIADEPVEFAYRGVDHMAEVWARYKSMTILRRMVVVGRSRRGTVPSRIAELHEAMLQNLEAVGRGVPGLAPIETIGQTDIEPAAEPVYRPATTEMPAAPVEEATPAAPVRPPLRPGAGLLARRLFQPATPVDEPTPLFASPAEETPVLLSPWDEPAFDEAPAPIEVEEPEPEDELQSVLEEGPEPVPAEPEAEPEEMLQPVLEEGPEPEDVPQSVLEEEPEPFPAEEPEEVPQPVLEEGPEPEEMLQPVLEEEPEPVQVPDPVLAEEPEELAPAASIEIPELVKELLGTSSDEGEEEGPRDLVVDLGHYEDGTERYPERSEEPPGLGRVEEPVLAAVAPMPERGGLLGAVRSAFARGKTPHEHEFVEAPGGIGIVRQICSECGHISIGVSD